jgi:hypothetical protein
MNAEQTTMLLFMVNWVTDEILKQFNEDNIFAINPLNKLQWLITRLYTESMIFTDGLTQADIHTKEVFRLEACLCGESMLSTEKAKQLACARMKEADLGKMKSAQAKMANLRMDAIQNLIDNLT